MREIFASAPGSKCIVVRVTADKPGSVSFRATMTRPADAATESAPDGRLILTGQALPKRAPGENNTGVRFRAEVTLTATGGRVESSADHLDVAGADSATLTIVAATDFREKSLAAACARDRAAASRPYAALRSEYVAFGMDRCRHPIFEPCEGRIGRDTSPLALALSCGSIPLDPDYFICIARWRTP
jgi:alpha-L-fucosidase 2